MCIYASRCQSLPPSPASASLFTSAHAICAASLRACVYFTLPFQQLLTDVGGDVHAINDLQCLHHQSLSFLGGVLKFCTRSTWRKKGRRRRRESLFTRCLLHRCEGPFPGCFLQVSRPLPSPPQSSLPRIITFEALPTDVTENHCGEKIAKLIISDFQKI